MKYVTTRILAVCLALSALLVSCPSPLGNAKSGTITLNFSGAPRAGIEAPPFIDPKLAIKTLLVEVDGPGMEKLTSEPVPYDATSTTLTMSIPAGSGRIVTISARNEADTVLYSQSQTVTIVAGKELQLSFSLDGAVYKVSFNPNGGSGIMDPQSIAYGSSAALTGCGFTKVGYIFVGWAASATSNANYADKADYMMGTTDATLYAVWMASNNTVAFNANGGSGEMTNQTIATDTTAPLSGNNFSRTGYTFGGWALTSVGAVAYANTPPYTMGPASTTLYAKWTANNNTVTFNANGGTETMADQTIATDVTAALSANSFIRTGYTFGGWALTSDGAVSYADQDDYPMGTASTILYAKWSIITYNIEYIQTMVQV